MTDSWNSFRLYILYDVIPSFDNKLSQEHECMICWLKINWTNVCNNSKICVKII